MPPRLHIPSEVLILNPGKTIQEIRTVINTILKAKSARLRQAHIVKVSLPGIGVLRSRGNKKPIGIKKTRARDRKRKRAKKIKS